MHRLELKVIPIFVFVIAAIFIWLLDSFIPLIAVDSPTRYVFAGLCFCASGYFGLHAIWDFRKAKTTVHPTNPHNASSVVSSGVYRVSRNPMYLGLLLLLMCEGLVLGNVSMILGLWGFVAYMNRFQIIPEERALEVRFGEEYLGYKIRVRRWI